MGKVVSAADLRACYPHADIPEEFKPTHRFTVDRNGVLFEFLIEVYMLDGLFWGRTPEEDACYASAPKGGWQCLTGPGKVRKVEGITYRKHYVHPQDRRGHVYFISRGAHVKIGWSQDVSRRLLELQIASPEPLFLEGTVEGTMADEQRFHKQFADLRGSGEWFRREGALEVLISGLKL